MLLIYYIVNYYIFLSQNKCYKQLTRKYLCIKCSYKRVFEQEYAQTFL